MTLPNRKTIRGALATNLSTAMVGTGKLLQAVYGYKPKTFGGLSPVGYIMSMPAKYNLLTNGGIQDIGYVVTFAARIDGAVGSGTDAAAAEDALDDAHYQLCLMLRSLYNAEFMQESIPDIEDQESGAVYLSESHYVRLLQVHG